MALTMTPHEVQGSRIIFGTAARHFDGPRGCHQAGSTAQYPRRDRDAGGVDSIFNIVHVAVRDSLLAAV
jgi:hypothetical protein